MGKLTIVRHGQAAFMTEDYDRLSPLGEEQSLALGRYWARHGVKFTHAFTGPRKRHREIIALLEDRHANRTERALPLADVGTSAAVS